MTVKFLIIRFSSIGDIVLTSPVVRCLKQQVKGAEVHFVTKQKFETVVASNPYINKVHLFAGNIKELTNRLKEEQFDYVIDLHKNFRSSRIKNQLKVTSFAFNKLNIEKFLLVNLKINRLPDEHIVDRYMETLSVFDVKNDGKGLDYFILENQEINRLELPESFHEGYVAFVIGGTWNTKKLPPHKVAEICNAIRYPVILLGGKNDEEVGEIIKNQTGANVLNFAGKINLNESAGLVRDARLVLTNDTGLMHIAAAFKKKILSFWGNTVPAFGMVPYLAHPVSELMEIHGLRCRPCSKLGFRNCPNKHFRCMEDQDTEKAVRWIHQHFAD